VAVGSHEPDARETDTALVRRAAVYVESRAAALREAGDLLIPEAEGAIGPGHLHGTLADLVAGRNLPGGRTDGPRLFKSVGMAWEDLAVAVAVYQATGANGET
ncbi:ornithine cyclodeaminase, partial [Streptomyces sp. RSD-27]